MRICSSPKSLFNSFLINACLLVLSWAVPWSILGQECLPGGNIFGLIILYDCCIVAGCLVQAIPIPKLPPLPPLLGMLLAGFALRNIPVINVANDIDTDWSAALRSLALTIILVKAGLELDASALKVMKGVCFRLTALPCLVETLTCAIMCYLLLGFSWEWGIMLGFVLGAVTPAVIVPSLLLLQEKGFGVDQGIPTLVIAASSFDDVLAISGFSIVLGITFSTMPHSDVSTSVANSTALFNDTLTTLAPSGDTSQDSDSIRDDKSVPGIVRHTEVETSVTILTLVSTACIRHGNKGNKTNRHVLSSDRASWFSVCLVLVNIGQVILMVARGPLEMLGGIAAGIIIGIALWYIPNRKQKDVTRTRTVLICAVGILAVFGTRAAGFPGSGALVAIVAPFVAAFKWEEDKVQISEIMGMLWKGFEPFMFGLIGAEITIESMDPGTAGLGLAVLFVGLLFRTLATFGAVLRAGLNFKEKLFVCLSWLPKATVQAAIGPVALDTARKANAPDEVEQTAKQILTIAVLSILITAPLGAAAIALSGPKLLQTCKVDDNTMLPLTDATSSSNVPKNECVVGEKRQTLTRDPDGEDS